MPIQAPQWTDYLNCPICYREFGATPRSPISLRCGHTVCKHCLKHFHRKQCPFDQTVIHVEPEEFVVNTALLQLAGYAPPSQPYHPPCIQNLFEKDRHAYDVIVRCMEHLAVFLKYCGNPNNNATGNYLSRPMQRKLVTLLQCAITDEEGRGRAVRAARSLGERTVTELILQHQNPHQLSANLWAAVRARGCQFLGPAMQEEVLKLVLLALEDGSALSRKVLVMFVVQRLEPHFPQASKTSIGHVVQLLYRASCFKVSKRECDSSLMQLKDEFRTYETLRREHDAQIVQIATEAGLRIAPDQWSALLYGDTAHKSHMQSIIDKLQTPQSFSMSIQELYCCLQRSGDPVQLVAINMHLDCLAEIDPSPDARSPSWQQLADVMTSLKEVVSGLINYLQQQANGRDANHNQKLALPERCPEPSTSQASPQHGSAPVPSRYKMSMCRDLMMRSYCPRGASCTFAHSDGGLERYRSILNNNGNITSTNGNYVYTGQVVGRGIQHPITTQPPTPIMPVPQIIYSTGHPFSQPVLYENVNTTGYRLPPPEIQPNVDLNINVNFPPPASIQNQLSVPLHQSGILVPVTDLPYFEPYAGIMQTTQHQRPDYANNIFSGPYTGSSALQHPSDQNVNPPVNPMLMHSEPTRNISPYQYGEVATEHMPPGFQPVTRDRRAESAWAQSSDVFNFDEMRSALSLITSEDIFDPSPGYGRAVGSDRLNGADRMAPVTLNGETMEENELEEGLQALQRRLDSEFKSTD